MEIKKVVACFAVVVAVFANPGSASPRHDRHWHSRQYNPQIIQEPFSSDFEDPYVDFDQVKYLDALRQSRSVSQAPNVQTPSKQPQSAPAPLNEPAKIQTSLNQPSNEQSSLNQPSSAQSSLNQPESSQGSLNQPLNALASLDQRSSSEASLVQPPEAQTALYQPQNSMASLNQPASSRVNQPASAQESINQPPNSQASLNQPQSVQVSLIQPPSVQVPLNQPSNIQEPKAQTPSVQEPKGEEHNIQENTVEEPNVPESSVQEPNAQEPTAQESSPESSAIEQNHVEFNSQTQSQSDSESNSSNKVEKEAPEAEPNDSQFVPLPPLQLQNIASGLSRRLPENLTAAEEMRRQPVTQNTPVVYTLKNVGYNELKMYNRVFTPYRDWEKDNRSATIVNKAKSSMFIPTTNFNSSETETSRFHPLSQPPQSVEPLLSFLSAYKASLDPTLSKMSKANSGETNMTFTFPKTHNMNQADIPSMCAPTASLNPSGSAVSNEQTIVGANSNVGLSNQQVTEKSAMSAMEHPSSVVENPVHPEKEKSASAPAAAENTQSVQNAEESKTKSDEAQVTGPKFLHSMLEKENEGNAAVVAKVVHKTPDNSLNLKQISLSETHNSAAESNHLALEKEQGISSKMGQPGRFLTRRSNDEQRIGRYAPSKLESSWGAGTSYRSAVPLSSPAQRYAFNHVFGPELYYPSLITGGRDQPLREPVNNVFSEHESRYTRPEQFNLFSNHYKREANLPEEEIENTKEGQIS